MELLKKIKTTRKMPQVVEHEGKILEADKPEFGSWLHPLLKCDPGTTYYTSQLCSVSSREENRYK